MTRVRLEILQWYALLGGGLAWAVVHVIGYFVSETDCSSTVTRSPHPELVFIVVAVLAVLAVVGAEAAAFVVYRATGDAGKDAPGPEGRLRFFAIAALLGNVLFFMIVVLDFAGAVIQLPCNGA